MFAEFTPRAVIHWSGQMNERGEASGHYQTFVNIGCGDWFLYNDNVPRRTVSQDQVTEKPSWILYHLKGLYGESFSDGSSEGFF